MRRVVMVLAWMGWCCTVASWTGPAAARAGERAIRQSDVVFMYDNPEMYEAYGCTALGWAGRADRDHIRRAHEMGVRQFSASVGFLTEAQRVIDFRPDFLDAAARNFAGDPFPVPWLWDHQYKGQSSWWWCTNSPVYRDYLEHRLTETMAAEPDGLHIDDYRGSSGSVTWLSGCFCQYCLEGFRQYLSKHVPRERLEELGIRDLAGFDYRHFLMDRGVTADSYKAQRAKLPLADEFLDFHVRANTEFVAAYHRRASELRGQPLTLCVNSGLNDAQALAIAPHLSYFCCEVHHQAESLAPATHPIAIYKLADGLDRPVTSTASGQDWAYVYEHAKPCLVRSWAALSYAFGHNLMAPHRQWCYTTEKGTHWYAGPTEEYAWLYRFVRAQAALLDGYQAVAPVAVVYSNAARRKHRGGIESICVELAERNVPFTVAVAGDNWLDYRLAADPLARCRAVILPAPLEQLELDAAQLQALDAARTAGRLVTWSSADALAELVPPLLSIDRSTLVMAVPRLRADKQDAPAVVHLLNRAYDGASDRMVAQQQFTLRLHPSLFGGRRFTRAVLHAPKAESQPLEVGNEGEWTTVTVPTLDLWGILALQ